ncbi:MAG: hypothetical protein J07HN4v3_02485 [Halonotius sp. J07HN4]|nr:MAG: hypothetical protein J07HN4v3_02485 [Halonotius sp. J07HN4]
MRVIGEVVNETTHDVSVNETATYADLIAEIGYSPWGVSVLVDDSLVPEDQPVAVNTVRVVRLIKGG